MSKGEAELLQNQRNEGKSWNSKTFQEKSS